MISFPMKTLLATGKGQRVRVITYRVGTSDYAATHSAEDTRYLTRNLDPTRPHDPLAPSEFSDGELLASECHWRHVQRWLAGD
jgi:hypothetical protein